jgi:hypothetical protein
MSGENLSNQAHIGQARELAGKLFDYRLAQLEHLTDEERSGLRSQFPQLTTVEVEDVVRQTIEAKRYEMERIGWQAVPHDAAVLVLVAGTVLVDLRSGVVAGVASLVLLESLFQFYFSRPLYRALSTLVWLTYPAYALLAYVLFRRGFALTWIVAAVALAWAGTFVLGMLARLPVRLILEATTKSRAEIAKRKR